MTSGGKILQEESVRLLLVTVTYTGIFAHVSTIKYANVNMLAIVPFTQAIAIDRESLLKGKVQYSCPLCAN